MRQAGHALNWCVGEMERHYKLMSKLGVRNLAGYNAKIADAEKREEFIPNPFSLTPDAPEPLSRLPIIVVVIDELADLMMVVGKKIEELIARLAQKARAAGIHLVLATQRPSKTSEELAQDKKNLIADNKDIRKHIVEPLIIRRTRTDIEKYYQDDVKTQALKFPKINNDNTKNIPADKI